MRPTPSATRSPPGGLLTDEVLHCYNLERPRTEVDVYLSNRMPPEDPRPNRLKYHDCHSAKHRKLGQDPLGHLDLQKHSPDVTKDALAWLRKHPVNTPFRLIVESASRAIESHGLDSTLQMLSTMTGIVRAKAGVALVMLQKGLHDEHAEQRACHWADGVIEPSMERQGFGVDASMTVKKMMGVVGVPLVLPFKATEQGLWVESTRRVM